jgi:hypothetical protein
MNVGCLASLAAILIAVLLLGCAIQVGHGYPKPNVDLSPREVRLGISFAPEVADELTVTTQGLRPIQIREWHGTLMQGFLGAFDESFELVDKKPHYRLVFVSTSIEAAPTAVSMYAGAVAITALVRYKVRLVAADGRVLARLAGTADAKRSSVSPDDVGPMIDTAVETMYEQIAKEIFIDGNVLPPAGPAGASAPDAKTGKGAASEGQTFCCESVDGRGGGVRCRPVTDQSSCSDQEGVLSCGGTYACTRPDDQDPPRFGECRCG